MSKAAKKITSPSTDRCLVLKPVFGILYVDPGKIFTATRDSATLFGLKKNRSQFTPVEDLRSEVDFE